MRLTQGIHRALQQRRTQPALLAEGVERSWGELADRVARFAGVLRARGVRPGDRVAMIGDNTPAMVEFYLATLWSGAVMVPVNTRWSLPEKSHCLRDAGAEVLLIEAAYLGELPALRRDCPALRTVLQPAVTEAADAEALEPLLAATAPVEDALRGGADLAALFYTGGTTGRAKGVMLSHDNLAANSLMGLSGLGISERSVHLHVSPLFHVAGGARVFTVTLAGGTHAMLPRFTPETFLAAIERYRVTVTVVVPAMLNALLESAAFDRFDLSSLELLCYGASPMPEALLGRAMAQLPGVRFLQSYGMTELSPVATMLGPEDHELAGGRPERLRSVGRAVPNADLKVVDAEDSPLPEGEVGEICVRGPMVMQGYWQQPELSEETLRGGWMHTGDAGYLDADGYLFLVDRVKDMIISGGENVYSAAVENVLYGHPDVLECAVIGVPSERWGEAVHAVVVPRPGAALDGAALDDHCRRTLAGFECPKSYELRAEPLPRSGAGKVLKGELREAWGRAPAEPQA